MMKPTIEEEIFDIYAPLNQERKFNHEECGDRRERLYVRRTEKGWIYNCFNCGVKGFKRASATNIFIFNQKSISDLGCKVCSGTNTEEFSLPRPSPFTKEARAWLAKYGITEEEQERYGIYYTNEWGGRVVLPVQSFSSVHDKVFVWGGRVVLPVQSFSSVHDKVFVQGYQLRLLSEKGPKYITRKKSKEKPLRFLSNSMQLGSNLHLQSIRMLVVVEDILSAIKVGRQCQALALLGSPKYLPCDVMEQIAGSAASNVGFWLDPDKFSGSIEYAKRYSSLYNTGQCVVAIRSDRDPKEHSDEEITQLLERSFP